MITINYLIFSDQIFRSTYERGDDEAPEHVEEISKNIMCWNIQLKSELKDVVIARNVSSQGEIFRTACGAKCI